MTEPLTRSTRKWALAVLAAVSVMGFEPFFLQALRIDREAAVRQYDELPYRRIPGLQHLCQKIRSRVAARERIAVWTPYPGWWDGYSFNYMRAAYLLADYRLIPLLDDRDRPHPEVLTEVDWVLALGGAPELEGFEPVVATKDAALMKRAK